MPSIEARLKDVLDETRLVRLGYNSLSACCIAHLHGSTLGHDQVHWGVRGLRVDRCDPARTRTRHPRLSAWLSIRPGCGRSSRCRNQGGIGRRRSRPMVRARPRGMSVEGDLLWPFVSGLLFSLDCCVGSRLSEAVRPMPPWLISFGQIRKTPSEHCLQSLP